MTREARWPKRVGQGSRKVNMETVIRRVASQKIGSGEWVKKEAE